MKVNIKLLKLKLRNFKGIKEFELDTQGKNVNVYGDNATGKTTIVDAFMWLLFDKDSKNRKDFEIKTLQPDGQPIHGLEHEVEAVLDIGDKTITLRKVFKEKWQKKRGSATAEFTGHTTDYYVDGIPVKKTEYEQLIAEIADENIFRLLTDPTYFNEHLHWQKRRELLLEICGDVTDEDVINSSKELTKLREILGHRTIEQHRKIILARRAEINKELERIPVRIDEVQRNLPQIDEDKNVIENKLEELREQRKNAEERRVRIQSGGQIAELQKRLSELQANLISIKNSIKEKAEESVRDERKQLATIEDQILKRQMELKRLETEQKNNQFEIERLKKQIEEKRAEWYKVNSQEFEEEPPILKEEDKICPCCGQPLPHEKVQEIYDKAVAKYEAKKAEFNLSKSKLLEQISVDGKNLKNRLEELESNYIQREKSIKTIIDEIQTLQEQADSLAESIKTKSNNLPVIEEHPEVKKIQREIAETENKIRELRSNITDEINKVTEYIKNIDKQIAELESKLSSIKQLEQGLKRINELKAEEHKLAAEYEELEHQLYLIEQFTRTKVQLLEERINSKFKLAKFKLFNELINGGVEETCETMYNGVPYSNLNHGARLNVGLDIINTLSDFYNFNAPIFVDNAEAVTQLIPTRSQLIRLVVSEKDKKLRMEYENNIKGVI